MGDKDGFRIISTEPQYLNYGLDNYNKGQLWDQRIIIEVQHIPTMIRRILVSLFVGMALEDLCLGLDES